MLVGVQAYPNKTECPCHNDELEDHFQATRLALHLLGGVLQRHCHPGGCPEVKELLRGAFTNLALATEASFFVTFRRRTRAFWGGTQRRYP